MNSMIQIDPPADEVAFYYTATRIAPKFGVSSEVIAKRLRVEDLWPPLDFRTK